jgi:hypothetical protein
MEWLANQARGRNNMYIEGDLVLFDKFPHFFLGGNLTSGIVEHGTRSVIWRWCPCSLKDTVIPRVSSHDAIVNTALEWGRVESAASEDNFLDQGLLRSCSHDRGDAVNQWRDDLIGIRDHIRNVGGMQNSRYAFYRFVVSSVSTEIRH